MIRRLIIPPLRLALAIAPPILEFLRSNSSVVERIVRASSSAILTVALPEPLKGLYRATAATMWLSELCFNDQKKNNSVYKIGTTAIEIVHNSVACIVPSIALSKALPDGFPLKRFSLFFALPAFHQIARTSFNSSDPVHYASCLTTAAICLYGGSGKESLPPAVN